MGAENHKQVFMKIGTTNKVLKCFEKRPTMKFEQCFRVSKFMNTCS